MVHYPQMLTQYTNSKGEYITVGQLAVRCVVYAFAGVFTLACMWAFTVLMFCM